MPPAVENLYNMIFIGGKDVPFKPSNVPRSTDKLLGKSINPVYQVEIKQLFPDKPALHNESDVAMKVIDATKPVAKLDYEQEIRIMNQARDCEEIVKFLGAASIEKHYYVFMEIMCMDLKRFLQHVPRNVKRGEDHYIKDEDLLAYIAVCMTRGLAYLKQIKYVHSDIKPANVLINAAGQVKIADLGIAKFILPDQGDKSVVSSNYCVTEQYGAPERLAGRSYQARSDVWSMGVTLHEVATGHYFYYQEKDRDSANMDEIRKKIRENDAPVLSKRESGFTLLMCTFINTCLVKDVKLRNDIDSMIKMELCNKKNTDDERDKGKKKMAAAVEAILTQKAAEPKDEKVDISNFTKY